MLFLAIFWCEDPRNVSYIGVNIQRASHHGETSMLNATHILTTWMTCQLNLLSRP